MNKINTFEAANVVGGTAQDCVYTYETILLGGSASCRLVASCTDKKGNLTQSFADVNDSNCGGGVN
ncbi:DUF4762 domain-containing protein [Enterobacteriaceae bacterium 4M9]|nr:DUF4762 domain-containing protein [Enterobacteriaceae bacterium 4M9]